VTPRPKSGERLEKLLARVAREQGLHQERLRRWVSFFCADAAFILVVVREYLQDILGINGPLVSSPKLVEAHGTRSSRHCI